MVYRDAARSADASSASALGELPPCVRASLRESEWGAGWEDGRDRFAYDQMELDNWRTITSWFDALPRARRAEVLPVVEAGLARWDPLHRVHLVEGWLQRLVGWCSPHSVLARSYVARVLRSIPRVALPRGVDGPTTLHVMENASVPNVLVDPRRGLRFPHLRHLVHERVHDGFVDELEAMRGPRLRSLCLADRRGSGTLRGNPFKRQAALDAVRDLDALESLRLRYGGYGEGAPAGDLPVLLRAHERLPALRRLCLMGGTQSAHYQEKLLASGLLSRLVALRCGSLWDLPTDALVAAFGPGLESLALTVDARIVEELALTPSRCLRQLELKGQGDAGGWLRDVVPKYNEKLDRRLLERLLASGWLDGLEVLGLLDWRGLKGDDLFALQERPGLVASLRVLIVDCHVAVTSSQARELFDGLELERLRLRYGCDAAAFGDAYRVHTRWGWSTIERW
jgi:hypothetical protein